MKGHDSGICRWNRYPGKGHWTSTLSLGKAPPCVHQPSSPNPAYGGFVEASLDRSDWWHHCSLAIGRTWSPLPDHPQRPVECSWRFQPSNHRVGCSPILGAVQKSLINKRCVCCSHHLGYSKCFRSCARNGAQNQICTSYYKPLYHKNF